MILADVPAWFTFFVNGAFRGGAYALAGLGLVLIFRTARVVNFAHGAIATFATFWFQSLRSDVPTPVALVLAVAAAGLLGALIELTTMRPLQERSQAAKLVATIGWLSILQYLTDLLFDRQATVVEPIFSRDTVEIFGVRIAQWQIGLLVVTLVLAALLWVWIDRTGFGRSLRAVAHDRSSAQLLGVDANRVTLVAWTVGGALAGLAGILIAPGILLESQAVTVLLFHSFAAALVAGFSSIGVLVVAALLLGGLEDAITVHEPFRAGGADLVMFVVLVATLLIRSSETLQDLDVKQWLARLRGDRTPAVET